MPFFYQDDRGIGSEAYGREHAAGERQRQGAKILAPLPKALLENLLFQGDRVNLNSVYS
jgi:hypothetical protein